MTDDKYNIAYLRLSHEDEDDGLSLESQSISSQRMCIKEYIATQDLNGKFEEIIDDGYSGTHFERPGIKKILKLVELGSVSTIIVRDLSRFARNYLEAGYYLEYVFPEFDVRFISINDGYDSADYGESTTGLHIAIKNLINQMYSKDISVKIKSAVDIKKMNGEFVYGTAPYGYKKGIVKNTIEPDDEVAHIVVRLFNLACAGTTISQIAKIFNDEKIQTPSMYLSKVRSKKYVPRNIWSYESVKNILTNRIYTGDTEPFKSHVVKLGSDRVKLIPSEERMVIENTHKALISRETYFQAQKVIRKTSPKSPPKGSNSVLNSFLVCGCCGNRLVKGKAQNKTFLCSTARYISEGECKQIRVSEAKMKEILFRAVKSQCMMMDSHIKVIRSTAKQNHCEIDRVKSKLRIQKRSLDGIQTAKMELYEKYVDEVYTKEEYFEKKLELNQKEQDLKSEIIVSEEYLKQASDNLKSIDILNNEQAFISKYIDISELNEELMRELIKKVTVYPNGSINISWNFKNIFDNNTLSII